MKKKNVEYEEDSSEEEKDSSDAVEEQASSDSEGADAAAEDNEDDGADDDQQKQTARIVGSSSSTSEQCTFDLRNLVAVNSHQLDATSLYSSTKKNKAKEDGITIPLTASGIQVDEDQLLEKAQDGCAQLIRALWQLPMESSDAGPMVTLPSYQEIKIPRALVRLCVYTFTLKKAIYLTYLLTYLTFSCS